MHLSAPLIGFYTFTPCSTTLIEFEGQIDINQIKLKVFFSASARLIKFKSCVNVTHVCISVKDSKYCWLFLQHDNDILSDKEKRKSKEALMLFTDLFVTWVCVEMSVYVMINVRPAMWRVNFFYFFLKPSGVELF